MPLCLSLLYNLGSRWGPRTGEEEQCCHGFILPHHVCVYVVYQILLVPVFSLWEESPTHVISQNVHTQFPRGLACVLTSQGAVSSVALLPSGLFMC